MEIAENNVVEVEAELLVILMTLSLFADYNHDNDYND